MAQQHITLSGVEHAVAEITVKVRAGELFTANELKTQLYRDVLKAITKAKTHLTKRDVKDLAVAALAVEDLTQIH